MEPPKWIIKLINLYCPPQLAESVIGDVWEQYLNDKERLSKSRAGRRLLWNALRFFRPGILLRNSKTQLINRAMLRINLLLALRNMRKYKFYSLINVLGLALSIMFGLLVFFYVQNAIQHDSFHAEHQSIFRFTKENRNRETNELISRNNTEGNQLASDLRNEIPSIQYISRLISGSGYVKKGSETFSEKIMLVDPDFFRMFSFPVLEGNFTQPLENISQVVISPAMVEKYFGLADPVGKELELVVGNDPFTFIVSAVADPIEELNSIPFDMVVHIDHLKNLVPSPSFLTGYEVSFMETYIKLDPSENVKAMEELLTESYERFAQTEDEPEKTFVRLQPISTLYWWSNRFPQEGEAKTYNPDYVYILIGLCLLVLVIAVLNFIMLTSSQSLNRIKEFGIRKTMGAFKRQLSAQLLLEVFILAMMAGLLALISTHQFIPVFNNLANATLKFQLSSELVGFIFLLIGIISVISSAISSSVILRLKTTSALKGTLSLGGSSFTKNLMVVVQFTFCVGLIIGTIAFKNQMNYVSNKSLGFEKDQLVEVELPGNLDETGAKKAYELFKTKLRNHPDILNTAATMTTMSVQWTIFRFDQEDDSKFSANFNLVSPDYVNTMGIELIAGRDFREDDTGKAIIINESMVKEMGWENPLGQQIPGKNFERSHEIIGVVKDFNFNSLHNEVSPLIMATEVDYMREGLTGISSYVWPPQYFTVMIKVAPGNAAETADFIETTWKETMGALPFEMKYVDDILNEKYKEEKRYSAIINYAAGFSLFIAWLGLLALTRLVIQKRFKEMGIRKVLGSSSLNIILLVARKFILLIGVATLLASPIAWWLLQDWLESFAYKVDLSPVVFILSGFAVIVVTFVSISIQSLKISNINPSEALRME
ncbi:ABC transporter permease [Ekhidna sp.]|uniref:ABC transporter permease n=1 Tax=Ekhidna sp. TaxID=2608089 RepID=UPI00329A75BC